MTKWLVAFLVVIGLVIATRSSVDQWNRESQKIRLQIASLEQELARAEHPERRQKLTLTHQALVASVPKLSNLRWDRVAIAGLLYAMGLVPPSLVLRRALLSLGEQPRVSTAIAAQLLGHVGKYVPGKAMVIVLRAGVLARDGVSPLRATVSVFLETFLMMAVGAAVAGCVVWWIPVPRWIAITAIIAAFAASIPTLPPILRLVAAKVTKVPDAEVPASEVDRQIGMRLFAEGWAWSVLSWLLIGAAFSVLISAIPSANPLPSAAQLYAVATAAIGLALVAGFASLLPGGIGVRELVITTILGVAIGTAHGLLAAIAARILFLVVEATLATLCWVWLGRGRQEDLSQMPPTKPASLGA